MRKPWISCCCPPGSLLRASSSGCCRHFSLAASTFSLSASPCSGRHSRQPCSIKGYKIQNRAAEDAKRVKQPMSESTDMSSDMNDADHAGLSTVHTNQGCRDHFCNPRKHEHHRHTCGMCVKQVLPCCTARGSFGARDSTRAHLLQAPAACRTMTTGRPSC